MAAHVDDMITLDVLTEDAILENLKARYAEKLIYTYNGKRLPDNAPHIFALAETAYANVRNLGVNQSVIISGESGAGKSESTKVILQYLTAVTSSQNQESWVEQQILEANTVLESFGNAKTIRNNNSSRFGKFIQVLFNSKKQIIGANIINYLLEKSRVAKPAVGERNYHVFYELVSGATPDEQQRYQLGAMDDYHYLAQSQCTEIDGVNDKYGWEGLKLAFEVLHLPETDMDGILRALSAVLWMGNIQFTEDASKESVTVANPALVERVAQLFGLEAKALTHVLVARRLTIRGETTVVPLKLDQAVDNRDVIAKFCYDSLFQRIIEFINTSLVAKDKVANFVGVLDIFGFEVFQTNSFEQFCINYTNEKLQQFFNQFIFKLEQEEYDKEAISWAKLAFSDNQICLDLIEARPAGILALLDEETRFPKSTDETWLQKLEATFPKQPCFYKPKLARSVFGVKHYAGEVLYTVTGFLVKNRDAMQDDVFDVFGASSHPYVKAMLKRPTAEPDSKGTVRQPTRSTASTLFKNQLVSLVTTLAATTPHYVRCIKPNPSKVAFGFDDDMVLSQLRYSGMLDTIRIRKAGYPNRMTFDVFSKQYRCLRSGDAADARAAARQIIDACQLGPEHCQMGKTKVFLKAEALIVVQERADAVLREKVLLIQQAMCSNVARRKFLRLRQAAQVLAPVMRGFVQRCRYRRQRQAIIKVQACVRRLIVRRAVRAVLEDRLRECATGHRKSLDPTTLASLTAAATRASASVAQAGEAVEKHTAGPKLPIQTEAAQMRFAEITAMQELNKKKNAAAPSITTATLGPPAAPGADPNNLASAQSRDLDSMFSFLSTFDPASAATGTIRGAAQLAHMANLLASEIDSLIQTPPAGTTKQASFAAGLSSAVMSSASGGTAGAAGKPGKSGLSVDVSAGKSTPALNASGLASPSSFAPTADGVGNETPTTTASLLHSLAQQEPGVKLASTTAAGSRDRLASSTQHLAASISHSSLEVEMRSKIDPEAPEVAFAVYAERHFVCMAPGYVAASTLTPGSGSGALSQRESKLFASTGGRAGGEASASLKRQLMNAFMGYTRGGLPHAITISGAGDLNELSMEAFRQLQRSIESGHKKPEDQTAALQELIKLGILHPELRDEIFVQLMRQGLVSDEAPKNYAETVLPCVWVALALVSAAFPPTKQLSKFLFAHVARAQAETDVSRSPLVPKLIRLVQDNIKTTVLNGPRRMPPSALEITHTKLAQPILAKFHFSDGQEMDIRVQASTTAAQIVRMMAEFINLEDYSGWSIYEVLWRTGQERAIRGSEYVFDVFSLWEREAAQSKTATAKPSGMGTLRGFGLMKKRRSEEAGSATGSGVLSPGANGAYVNIDANLVLKKRHFRNIYEPITDQIEYLLLYSQAVDAVARDQFPITLKTACQLAALRAQAGGDAPADAQDAAAVFAKAPSMWLSPRVLSSSESLTETVAQITMNWSALRGTSPARAKALFLETVKNLRFYGAAQFQVRYKGFWSWPETITLVISAEGMEFVHAKSRETIQKFHYANVLQFESEEQEILLQANIYDEEEGERQESYRFATGQGEEIVALIRDYYPDNENRRKIKDSTLSAADYQLLRRDLDKCRAQLLSTDFLAIPGPSYLWSQATSGGSGGHGTAVSPTLVALGAGGGAAGGSSGSNAGSNAKPSASLRRFGFRNAKNSTQSLADHGNLSSNAFTSAEALPTPSQDPGAYTLADWSYHPAPLLRPLTKDLPQGFELLAVAASQLFIDMGAKATPRPQFHPEHMLKLQNIMEKCLEAPVFAAEIFAQLLKLTTSHQLPDSPAALTGWRLMVSLLGLCTPSGKLLDLYRAHLRKYVHVNMASKKPRRQEAACAVFCTKMLNRGCALVDRPRKFPASFPEIAAAAEMKHLRIRFGFLDGQYRAVSVDPWDTAADVQRHFTDKIKLKNAGGFGIYETYSGLERHLGADERISDILYKWEYFARQHNATDESVQFIFKKRMFLTNEPPGNDLESTLLKAQASWEIRNDLYPVTEEEAIYLAALECQIRSSSDYGAIVVETIPARLAPESAHDFLKQAISVQHAGMKKMSVAEAQQTYMQRVRAWPLYGVTVFDVVQTYTTAIPRACWLAVGHDGVYILQRYDKDAIVHHAYADILSFSPSPRNLLVVTEGTKYVFSTQQSAQIAGLMRDYIACQTAAAAAAPSAAS
ncbi:hypothetical protein CXG81DRAFT_24249 [Caulochytrium protostelioides]|uniref:Myosin motor domain-containing protein n=1 Tax=Caulochytrium protostelioides TaxID=1555241 RepID=A0A4P9XCJ6_9FUNG|nr:hypothetical protein CXG81DRAFT_24249 [Caulochytrium protostelioides]|eukprot:RKP03142.1 hypothetical protein CXG81DRAFT_24249 [Caulochytrium protostelioides]